MLTDGVGLYAPITAQDTHRALGNAMGSSATIMLVARMELRETTNALRHPLRTTITKTTLAFGNGCQPHITHDDVLPDGVCLYETAYLTSSYALGW